MHESQFAHLVLQTASYSKVHSTVTRLLFFIAILSFFFVVCGLECGAVGVEDRNKIPDARMTASTYFDGDFYPYYGRLNEMMIMKKRSFFIIYTLPKSPIHLSYIVADALEKSFREEIVFWPKLH